MTKLNENLLNALVELKKFSHIENLEVEDLALEYTEGCKKLFEKLAIYNNVKSDIDEKQLALLSARSALLDLEQLFSDLLEEVEEEIKNNNI